VTSDTLWVMQIDREAPDYIWEQILDCFRQRIASGEWPPRHRIPPLSALAEEHDVSVTTVQKALKTLKAEGVLISRPGRGIWVRG
jgi:DNA-binding GntR family transcriptional regulator